MSKKTKSPFEDKCPVKAGTKFLVEVEIKEDHGLLGGDLLNLFYNTEKVLGKKVKFSFNKIYLKEGYGTIEDLKGKMREAFNEQLEKMFSRQDYEQNNLKDLLQ